MPDLSSEVAGYAEFVAFCGGFPSFHDSEVVSLHLNRQGSSHVKIDLIGWEYTDPGEVARLRSISMDTLVTFLLEDIHDLELGGFNFQNVISELSLEMADVGCRLTMWPCYGIAGWIHAGRVRIEFAQSLAG